MAVLLASLRGFRTSGLVSRTSSETGESEPATAKAYDGILPVVLGGLVSRTSEPGALCFVFNLIREHNESPYSNMSSTVRGAPDTTVPAGNQFSAEIFDKNLESVSNSLSNYKVIKS